MQFERRFDLINRKFRELFIPSTLLILSDNLVVVLDAALISLLLGFNYLSIVQISYPFVYLFALVYWMVGHGGSILCSIARSDFDEDESNRIFTVSIIGAVLISLLFTVSYFLFPDAYLQLICSDTHLWPSIQQYLNYFILSCPFITYTSCMAFFIKYYGFIKLQFRAFLMANVINIVLDFIFMKYLNLGISGASLAMFLGFLCASIYISSYFFSAKKSIRFVKVNAVVFFRYLVNICKFGFSTASVNLFAAFQLILINLLLMGLAGTVGLDALNICMNISEIVVIFVMGTIDSIVPIVSVYFEEEDYNGVDYVCNKAVKIIIAISLFFLMLFAVFPDIVLYLFNIQNPEYVPAILSSVRLFALSFVGTSINLFYIFYCQAVQYNKLAYILSVLEILVFPVFFAYLLSDLMGLMGVPISFSFCEYSIILIIFIYSRYISRKEDDGRFGFFLNRHNDEKSVFEYTICGNMDDAFSLSETVQKSLSNSELSDFTGLAIKEILVHIIEANDEIDLIDVIVRDKMDAVIFSIKYPGILYNPAEDENLHEDSVLNKIGDGFKSSYILELNNVEITIRESDLQ